MVSFIILCLKYTVNSQKGLQIYFAQPVTSIPKYFDKFNEGIHMWPFLPFLLLCINI